MHVRCGRPLPTLVLHGIAVVARSACTCPPLLLQQISSLVLHQDTQPLGSISLEGARLALDEGKFWRGTYGYGFTRPHNIYAAV